MAPSAEAFRCADTILVTHSCLDELLEERHRVQMCLLQRLIQASWSAGDQWGLASEAIEDGQHSESHVMIAMQALCCSADTPKSFCEV